MVGGCSPATTCLRFIRFSTNSSCLIFRRHLLLAPPARLHPSAPAVKTSTIHLNAASRLQPMSSISGRKEKVAIIGSGNWGSAIARIAALNTKQNSDRFEPEVVMWVKEEEFEGRQLSEVINQDHENVKYLPGIHLGENVKAEPDLQNAVRGATALVVVLPHQFVESTLEAINDRLEPGVRVVTLIKGIHVEGNEILTFPTVISKLLKTPCAALGGANIANEVARDRFSESTLAIPKHDGQNSTDLTTRPDAVLWKSLFQTPTFRIQVVEDVEGVALCGALKNIVAMGAGFVDGLGWGDNAKAAVMRIGLMEMMAFCFEFFPGTQPSTFLQESCGVADVMTSCMGGRNYKVAVEMVKSGKSFQDLETDMLNGQKLQGALTANEVYKFLQARGVNDTDRSRKYALFEGVWKVCFEGMDPSRIVEHF